MLFVLKHIGAEHACMHACMHVNVEWNVGIVGLEYVPYHGGRQYLLITSGTLPDGSQARERIISIDAQALRLVIELLAGVAQPRSLNEPNEPVIGSKTGDAPVLQHPKCEYRAAVKRMFMAANLSHMMPPSIRTARI
jgi:hypothetical protein